MPCTLTGSREGDLEWYLEQRGEEVTKLAQLLCKACTLLDEEKIKLPKNLKTWWKKHQEIDAQRIEAERKPVKRKKIKKGITKKVM
jgi:hypothetical protein